MQRAPDRLQRHKIWRRRHERAANAQDSVDLAEHETGIDREMFENLHGDDEIEVSVVERQPSVSRLSPWTERSTSATPSPRPLILSLHVTPVGVS